MGTNAELESSALSRFLALVRLLSAYVARRLGRRARAPSSAARIATAVIGAAVAAAGGVGARRGRARRRSLPTSPRRSRRCAPGYQACSMTARATS